MWMELVNGFEREGITDKYLSIGAARAKNAIATGAAVEHGWTARSLRGRGGFDENAVLLFVANAQLS